jgi:hypothetical protein
MRTQSLFALSVVASAILSGVICLTGCPGGGGSGADAGPGTPLRADRPWDPATCSPFSPSEALGGTCTDYEFIEYYECTADACQAGFEACYGAGFRSGEYTGACKPFIDCARRCDCYDTDCVLACPIALECWDCLDGLTCEHECNLSCEVIGPRSGKTCQDTLMCCPGLPDESTRADCFNGVENLRDEPDGGKTSPCPVVT